MSFENGAPSAPTAPQSAPSSSPASGSAGTPAPSERPSVAKNPFVRRETPPASGSIPQTPPTPNRGEAPASGSAGPEGAPLDQSQAPQLSNQQPAQQQQQVPQQVVMTPEMLAQMMRGVPQQPVQQPQEQFNEQEFKQKYNIYDFSDKDYEAVFGVAPDSPQRVQAFNNILQNIAKQSVTLAQALAQMEIQKQFGSITEQFAPIQQQYKAQVEEGYKQEFFKSYPHLAGREPMLREIVQNAVARGIKFNNAADAMKYVAEVAHKFVAPPQASPANVPQGAQSRPMPTTSTGGRAGGSAPSKPLNTAQAIFGRTNR